MVAESPRSSGGGRRSFSDRHDMRREKPAQTAAEVKSGTRVAEKANGVRLTALVEVTVPPIDMALAAHDN